MHRRKFLGLGIGACVLPIVGRARAASQRNTGRVVVIGGGFGGATAARYLRIWDPGIEVILVERNKTFVSCPMSNLVIGGSRKIEQLTHGYQPIERVHGVHVVHDTVQAIDGEKKRVRLQGSDLSYDRIILAPGVDFLYDEIPGLNKAGAQESIVHAWKAGPQTVALRRQLEAMPDGGVYVIGIPLVPYRCPPGPYERVCQVAHYFSQEKPRSKIIVLDANADIVSKKALFAKIWRERYPQMIDYRPNSRVIDVDPATRTAITEFDQVKADVLNVIPPQRAADLARDTGLLNVDQRWVGVDFLSYESTVLPGVHVVGDAIAAPPTPKSGHMANQMAKITAAAVLAKLRNKPINPDPVFANTCYSYVSDNEAAHVAAVYRYDKAKRTLYAAEGSSGVSEQATLAEAAIAGAWARNIWNDTLAV